MLTAVVGLAAFYGGHPLLSSPTRSRACVAHMGDVPHGDEPVVKTSQGIDVEAAAAEISRLLKEQEAADAAAAAEMGDIADKDAVTSEIEAALEAEAAKAKKLWIEQEEALQAAKAKQLRIEQEEAKAEQLRIEQEEARALEVERIKQEEAAALEAKRLAAAKAAVCRGDMNPPPPPPCCPRTGRLAHRANPPPSLNPNDAEEEPFPLSTAAPLTQLRMRAPGVR